MLKCKKPDGTKINVTYRLFYPNCPKLHQFCNPLAGAYVSAITVCRQRLW